MHSVIEGNAQQLAREGRRSVRRGARRLAAARHRPASRSAGGSADDLRRLHSFSAARRSWCRWNLFAARDRPIVFTGAAVPH
jgi:hypothetical protein